MKSNQILMAGALALSMILSGCSASSTSEDVKDDKITETAKKADSKKPTMDKKESSQTETKQKIRLKPLKLKKPQIQKTRR